MKGVLYLFAGCLLGVGSASAQVTGLLAPDSGHILIVGSKGNILSMAPDRMPCLIPVLARVEHMPSLRSSNRDPMPNGLRRPRPIIMGQRMPDLIKPDEK